MDERNSSYIFGLHNESGWGERYFFTYYSEFGTRATTSVAIEAAVYSVVFILSTVTNVGIPVCVLK